MSGGEGEEGSRRERGRVKVGRFRPPRDTVLKRYRVARPRSSPRRARLNRRVYNLGTWGQEFLSRANSRALLHDMRLARQSRGRRGGHALLHGETSVGASIA
jgi:hypothetical protein